MNKLLILLTAVSTTVHAQNWPRPSASVFANSRFLSSGMGAGIKLSCEQFLVGPWQLEGAASITGDNPHPITSILLGVETDRGGDYDEKWNYRIAAGGYYHSGLLLPIQDTHVRIHTLKWGGSARAEIKRVIFTLEYNGETVMLGGGFLFRRKGGRK